MDEIRQLIEKYADGYRLIEQAVEGLTEAEWSYKPSPDAWSVKEIVIHLGDSETVVVDRMKRVIAEDRPPMRTMYQELWAERLRYAELDPAPYLQLFRWLRETMTGVLRTLDADAFDRYGVHDEVGELTLKGLLIRYTEHVDGHAAQIERNKAAYRRAAAGE